MTECQINAAPFFQCCCNCTLRLTDYKHCTIHPHAKGTCVCSEVKGYICAAGGDEGIFHSEWPEHSRGCELYIAKSPRAVAMGNVEYSSWVAS